MSVLLATMLLAATAPSATAPPPCDPPKAQIVTRTSPRPHRLDKLPYASLYLAVDRRVNNCPAPLIIRSAIGG
jgi:hypothetical protein